jgi:hypothetical protein
LFYFLGFIPEPNAEILTMRRINPHKMEEESKTIRTPPIYLFIYFILLYYPRAGDKQVPSPCDIFPS